MVRAGTAGVHPAFVRMVRELVAERMPDRAWGWRLSRWLLSAQRRPVRL